MYKDRSERISRVPSVKDVCIVEKTPAPDFLSEGKIQDSTKLIKITRGNTEWPFRVEYIEQLLEIKDVWVVVVETNGQNPLEGLDISVTHTSQPTVFSGTTNLNKKPLLTEGALLELEERITANFLFKSADLRNGQTSIEGIDLFKCNILPFFLTFYNATFYDREIAHLYVDSLSEHFKRFYLSR